VTRRRLTIRARLTLTYAALFLLAGSVLLALTYLLVQQQAPGAARMVLSQTGVPAPPGGPVVTGKAGIQIATTDMTLIQKAVDTAQRHTLTSLLTQGGIALALVATVATVIAWLVAGRMVRPLHRVTETARRIAAAPDRALHERIAMTGPRDELRELADTFDEMLARLDTAFDGQRTFIANASHELRTPLTLNRALIEVAASRPAAPTELRQLGEVLLEINSRHERLIDGLLILARAEPQLTERAYVDLADIVDHVVSSGDYPVRVMAEEAPTSGNPMLLERLVSNLVDNGIRHNLPKDGWVSVRTGAGADDTVRLVVSNTGPVVPRYEIPTLFEPFRRLGPQRLATPGVGLGLSIVAAIATAHDGTVVADPRPGGGLTVTVTLPAST
jgi:signal transduction histidine kinase